ncbi:hypothetical protein BKA93DRAFT_733331 [Sparassis latifolia]
MSNSSADRDDRLLSIGKQCSAPSCFLVDFLPFKCQHCNHSFCGEHFLPEAHKCDKFDASKHNRVAPSCPLCNTPVAVPPGEDPNIRMELHISTQCSVMTGKSGKTSSMPVCARGNCKKVLFSPIRCDKCQQQFCPQHRFPMDHACASAVPRPSSTPAKSGSSVVAQTSAASSAAMAAIKRGMASSGTSSSVPRPPSRPTRVTRTQNKPQPSAKASSSTPNLFSATDR